MRTQQVTASAFYIEGVVHGTRGVILGRVQCSEVVKVGFNFRTIGQIKTNGGKNFFNAFKCAHGWMQTASSTHAAWLGDIDCLRMQLGLHGGIGQRLALGIQHSFNLLFQLIDFRATGFLFFGRQRGHAFKQLGDFALLAQKLGLDVFKTGWVCCRGHGLFGLGKNG